MFNIQPFIEFVRGIYSAEEAIPLHEPLFVGNEKEYVQDCIETTFVSSVGEYVNRFERAIANFTGSKFAIATVNGTSALHTAIVISGVEWNDEVITQPLTFVATLNAIKYAGAIPVFVDVDIETMGMSPNSLLKFLEKTTSQIDGKCINNKTKNIIKACIPMHTFGHPAKIKELADICEQYKITLIEDAAESIGSFYKSKHTGTFGRLGVLSFNGNKTITCGGGGAVITDDKTMAQLAKHITTTAKVDHQWEYCHDMLGYNYRMPNINAALACAQLEMLEGILKAKRNIANSYKEFFASQGIDFFNEPDNCKSNYWLNTIILDSLESRDRFLKETNSNSIMTRPIWTLMNKLPMYKNYQNDGLSNAEWLERRVINIPSSVKKKHLIAVSQ